METTIKNSFDTTRDSETRDNKIVLKENNIQNELNSSNSSSIEMISTSQILLNYGTNILTSLSFFVMFFFESHFVGKLNNLNIYDAYGVGMTFKSFFFTFFICGLTEGVSVLCSKTFGNHKLSLFGQQMNQIFFICNSSLAILVLIFLLFGKQILILISGGHHSYLDISQRYIMYMLIGMVFELNYLILSKYLIVNMKYSINNVISISFYFICPILLYLFITVLQYKELGIALSFDIAAGLKFLIILIYVLFFHRNPITLFIFNSNTFEWSSLKETIKVSFYSMAIYFCEGAGVWALHFVASRLSNVSYGRYVILTVLIQLNYVFQYALFLSLTIYLGYYIGINSPKNMTKVACTILTIGFIIELIISVTFIFASGPIIEYINSNHKLDSGMKYYVYSYCVFMFPEFCLGYLMSCLRICNKLEITTIFAFGFQLILMPIGAWVLALVIKLDVWGIIISEFSTTMILVIIFTIYYMNLDFKKLCNEYKQYLSLIPDEENEILADTQIDYKYN